MFFRILFEIVFDILFWTVLAIIYIIDRVHTGLESFRNNWPFIKMLSCRLWEYVLIHTPFVRVYLTKKDIQNALNYEPQCKHALRVTIAGQKKVPQRMVSLMQLTKLINRLANDDNVDLRWAKAYCNLCTEHEYALASMADRMPPPDGDQNRNQLNPIADALGQPV